jgi:altronate dehydratase
MPLSSMARLPAPGDNLAIATRTLAAGTRMAHAGREFALDYAVLEGHRFAIQPIAAGESLLSWGLPFGTALRDIAAGEYAANAAMLEALHGRGLPFPLPAEPNFGDATPPFVLDEARFQPGVQVPPAADMRTFDGFQRGPARGVGTRNHIVLLGTTSRTSSFVRQLEARLKGLGRGQPNFDGVVAVAHTEGAGPEPVNNRDLLLRTLAGFMVHPNVGAVLAVDDGPGPVSNATLLAYLREHAYPIDEVPHAFMTLTGSFQADLEAGAAQAQSWLPIVTATARTPQPLTSLSLALQCGGSDAFSGVSANPLAGALAKLVVAHGGSANLAETTELMGAEAYALANVRDLATARKFLGFIERYKALLAWHGIDAESNPSGGNRYRGLYNIALKSIGAAAKRDPAVRLDYAVDYGERMREPGYYFMHTPGNDLESVAGQVAGGSNLIVFTTGNGSITNFPFVPTIKVMTTTARYRLLAQEMDINAGQYLDGTPLDELADGALDLAIAIASGQSSQGERAGHAQVSIWRDWRQTAGQPVRVEPAAPSGHALPIRADGLVPNGIPIQALRQGERRSLDQVGLILPTSLCAGQVSRLAAEHLNQLGLGKDMGLSRFAALVHTEGCGSAGQSTGALYSRTLLNYMLHPLVRWGLFLEHGCEKTHNDYMRAQLAQAGGDPARFGWASVQLDGGIEKVLRKIEDWLRGKLAVSEPPSVETAGLDALRLGLLTAEPVPAPLGEALAALTRTIVAAGGTVVVPQSSTLLASAEFLEGTLGKRLPEPTLAYGQSASDAGFHIMQTPTSHWVETLTGLGATGVEIMLACPGARPAQGHPLVPMLHAVVGGPRTPAGFDVVLDGEPGSWALALLGRLAETGSRRYTPQLFAQGAVDFQLTRGLMAMSV